MYRPILQLLLIAGLVAMGPGLLSLVLVTSTGYGQGTARAVGVVEDAVSDASIPPVITEDAAVESEMPSLFGTWRDVPDLVVCAAAPVSQRDVELAVAWWEALGHPLGSIHYVRAKREPWLVRMCRADRPVGHIVLRLGRDEQFVEEDSLAETHMFVSSGVRRIEYAKIYFRDGESLLPRVVEHEIGHAIGYKHLDELGHLMHMSNAKGGWNARGLRLAERPSTWAQR